MRYAALGVALAVSSGCASVTRVPASDVPRIAVISAFDAEWVKLRAAAEITGSRVINGRTHYLGRLAGQDVVLMLSGVSMVNAAMTTQTLLDRFTIRQIVFSGIAGGVNPSLHVGDVTVPAQWGNYQEQVFARQTPTGWDPGPYRGEFANFGMMFPRGTPIAGMNGTPDAIERRFWFPVDSAALATARAIARSVRLSRCTGSGQCLAHEPTIVAGGNGVSGPTFVDNAEYRAWAWTTFQADALDMETAAVAVVANQNRVPWIAFRSLSDLAGGGAGANEARVFGQLAADNSAAVVIAYLTALPRR
ncbi:MAG: 5'-methylthioadenosine/S-adenosylhomocysteine nucleosidase [Gemmatimonadota bacterium]